MKVLWITFWGPWVKPLLKRLNKFCELQIIVPDEGKESYTQEDIEGLVVHNLSFRKGHGLFVNMDREIFSRYEVIINRFKPDIIHIQGTEKNLAQIQNFIKDIPIAISIQGLLSGCLRYNPAFLYDSDMLPFTSIKNRFRHGGLLAPERSCERGVKNYEMDILRNGKYYLGRTIWDKAHTKISNPKSLYFYGGEVLRDVFYEKAGNWSVNKCRRHSIMMPSGYNPLKGMHFAITATAYIKQFYPDVLLKVPGIPLDMFHRKGFRRILIGEEFLSYCKNLVNKYHVEENVMFLPYLSEEDMTNQMLASNVFLSCSTIDNSSNAVSEATMLGLPLVVSAVGGIISFIKDGETGLFAPSGDSYVMAEQIMRIFENDELANSLSRNEYKQASMRLEPESIVNQYMKDYHQIIEHFKALM